MFWSRGLEQRDFMCGLHKRKKKFYVSLYTFPKNLFEILFACRRHDLTQSLKSLQCKTLIFVGENSPFHAESVYMNAKMDGKSCALVEVGLISWISTISFSLQSHWIIRRWEIFSSLVVYYQEMKMNRLILYTPWQVQACGSLVTEEHPDAMLIPIEFFLMGFGYYRQPHFASSSSNDSNPTSPSSCLSMAPELFSPEGLGIKLKPIKTRANTRSWCTSVQLDCLLYIENLTRDGKWKAWLFMGVNSSEFFDCSGEGLRWYMHKLLSK